MRILNYKGYHTKVEFDAESLLFMGRIEGIGDFVNFEGASMEQAEDEFHKAVEDYIGFCADVGKEPDRPRRPAAEKFEGTMAEGKYPLAQASLTMTL